MAKSSLLTRWERWIFPIWSALKAYFIYLSQEHKPKRRSNSSRRSSSLPSTYIPIPSLLTLANMRTPPKYSFGFPPQTYPSHEGSIPYLSPLLALNATFSRDHPTGSRRDVPCRLFSQMIMPQLLPGYPSPPSIRSTSLRSFFNPNASISKLPYMLF